MQSRASSLIEAGLNTAVGFVISLGVSAVVLPLYGVPPSLSANLQITAIFTVTSLIRAYVIRRYFNGRLHKLADTLAKEID